MTIRACWTRVGTPAVWALRAHWITAALLVTTGAVALGALLPVGALFGGAPLALHSRLAAPAIRNPDLPFPRGADAVQPTDFRAATDASLFSILTLVAAGVFLVAAITLLAVADARGAARTSEISVRRAVGASRRMLYLTAVVESSIVASAVLLAGGLAGLVGAHAVGASWPGPLAAGTLWMTVAVVGALLLLLAAGVSLPATRERRQRPIGGRRGRALELVLPTVQLGLSLTVLGAAALLVRRGAAVGPSAPVARGSGVVFDLSVPNGPTGSRARAYGQLIDRLKQYPGVQTVSLTSAGAELGLGIADRILTECGRCAWGDIAVPWHLPFVTHYLVSADTFQTLHLRVIEGRGFTNRDTLDAPRVAVVSASLAANDFEGGHAVGRRLQLGHGQFDWYTVVGIVPDQIPAGYGGGLQPTYAVYLSVLQHPARAVDLLVRADGDANLREQVAGSVRAALGAGSRVRWEAEAQRVVREAAPIRWFGRWYGAEGWVMLAIATLGTFVVMWLWVASLSHDLAVRRAVGARRGDVFRFVLARAAGVAIGGVVLGLWCGITVWGAIRSIVAGLPAWQPDVLVRYASLLVAAAIAGAFLPTWRAVRTPPSVLMGHADE